ncbi:hypothetical protein K0M31_014398, partial [Melipona bicolor]
EPGDSSVSRASPPLNLNGLQESIFVNPASVSPREDIRFEVRPVTVKRPDSSREIWLDPAVLMVNFRETTT